VTATSAPGFVLDASVTLAAFFEDEQDDYSLGVWRSMVGAQAWVPALWHLEIANILSRAQRRGRITAQALDESWERLACLQIRVVPVTPDAQMWTRMATDWGLGAYDACYLDTALRHRLPLATRDRALAEASARLGVPLYLSSAASRA
jgi:predicted nucleic acid-binding protein